MPRLLTTVLTAAVLAVSVLSSQAAVRHVPGEILIKIKAGSEAGVEAFMTSGGSTVKKNLKQIGYRLLKLPPGATVEQAVERWARHPGVEYAGPNHVIRAVTDQLWPYDDPVFWDGYDIWDMGLFIAPPQWGLYNDGVNASAYYTTLPGKVRADIHALEAWYINTGSPGIVIANLDTGVDDTHPDLYNKVILPGYNAIDGSSNAADDNGHGTFTAGISAARAGNYEGVVGVAWSCPVLPVKVIDSTGYGSEADAADGILWAVAHGAKVLNMSFATDLNVPALEAAINYAWQQGCISVCASGNENVSTPMYPAAYTNALAVGATNTYDRRCTAADWGSGGSNYGPYLDVAAPGHEITSTWSDPYLGQVYFSAPGTSAAAPFVTGVVALVWSEHPEWTNQQVVDQIKRTADDVEATGWDEYTGWGRVNAYRALTEVQTPIQRIGELAALPDGRYVEMANKVVTAGSGQITNMAYIEEPDRSAGIMVHYPSGVPAGLAAGDRVDVTGTLGTVNGERALVATLTKVSSGAALRPLAMSNRQAVGRAAALSRGLLVKMWGRVTEVGWTYIYIDDGSNLGDGFSPPGLRVEHPSPSPAWEGKIAVVVGPLGMSLPSGTTSPVPVLRPRRPADVLVLP